MKLRILMIVLGLLVSSLGYAEEPLEVLIIGCSRSGTVYISKVLQSSGLDVRHELIGENGAVSWTMTTGSSKTPWGPGSGGHQFKHVFHQVRNPLDVISSVYAVEPSVSWNYILAFLPQIKPHESKIIRCAKYWIYWNEMAEKKAEWTYKVEDMPYALRVMQNKLKIPLSIEDAIKVSTSTNSRAPGKHVFTWNELKFLLPKKLFLKLQQKASQYSYPIKD